MTDANQTPQAMEEFASAYRTYQRALIAFLRRRGVEPDEAHDLVQETFVRAFGAWGTFRAESSRKTWLMNIALNVWRNQRRWHAALKRGGEHAARDDAGEDAVATAPARPADAPDAPLRAREQRELVKDALAELPAQMQRCVLLYLDNRKYREIAEELDISIGAVKSQISDGRRRLRARINQHFSAGGV